MFGLFSNKKNNECPIDQDMRLWMENAFLWLVDEFEQTSPYKKPMLYPTSNDFPIKYDGSKESLLKTSEVVASQMDIDINELNIDIFDQSIREINGDFGHRIWTEVDKNSNKGLSAGLYFDKNIGGRYDIFIEKKNLSDPENMVATLAHEFSHIKLLGEKRTEFNDEYLTDLTVVIFGLGVFNANAAFKEHKSFDSYGHNSMGYLKQKEWGYALALYTYYRQDDSWAWIKYLTANIRSDFKKSMEFILANKDRVFIEKI